MGLKSFSQTVMQASPWTLNSLKVNVQFYKVDEIHTSNKSMLIIGALCCIIQKTEFEKLSIVHVFKGNIFSRNMGNFQ